MNSFEQSWMIITFEIDHVIWTIDKSRDCKISHDKNTQRVSAAYSALFSPAVMSLRSNFRNQGQDNGPVTDQVIAVDIDLSQLYSEVRAVFPEKCIRLLTHLNDLIQHTVDIYHI